MIHPQKNLGPKYTSFTPNYKVKENAPQMVHVPKYIPKNEVEIYRPRILIPAKYVDFTHSSKIDSS